MLGTRRMAVDLASTRSISAIYRETFESQNGLVLFVHQTGLIAHQDDRIIGLRADFSAETITERSYWKFTPTKILEITCSRTGA